MVTTLERSQRGYLRLLAAVVHCGHRLHHLRNHRESIWGLMLQQYIITRISVNPAEIMSAAWETLKQLAPQGQSYPSPHCINALK